MIRMRPSGLVLTATFVVLLATLLWFRDALLQAHVDQSIQEVASDAALYFDVYQSVYADAALQESPTLFLIGSPILFMKLAGGDLFLIEVCNLALMFFTLRVALGCLTSLRGRLLFVSGALIFPYFLFGFLGLNKEIYAMCSAVLFGSYFIRGRLSHLVLALLIGACARYYMLVALLVLLVTVPRDRPPRYTLIISLLFAVSLVAPITKQLIPEYSTEGLLEDSGRIGLVFASIIDHYGYAVAYPAKYVLLLPSRAYGYLIGATEDATGAAVSVVSTGMFLWICRLLIARGTPNPTVRRLIVAGLTAPIPIMWSEIMHWRYYSFVYFFFLYAAILHMEARRARVAARRTAAARA